MKKSAIAYSIIVFTLLLIFFIVIHPIAIFDTDDWSFIHHLRLPIPVIHAWNPIKVFPEVFMSIFSYFAAYVIYPITGRYCFSMSIANGVFICFIITVYFLEFYLLIQKKYALSLNKSIFMSVIFISLHFLLVIHPGKDNIFLFYAYDMTCVYHYTLSTVINAALVMHMIHNQGFSCFSSFSKQHKLVVLIWTYLAIFSSLYTNIILAVYVGIELLFSLRTNHDSDRFLLSSFISKYKAHLVIMLVWFSSFAFELTGGRSSGHESNIFASFISASTNILTWGKQFNIIILIFSAITVLLYFFLSPKKNLLFLAKCFIAFLLTTLYLILLSAVVDSTYITRIDVMFASFFWLLLIIMLLVCELSQFFNHSAVILGIMSALFGLSTMYASSTYKEMNYSNIPYKQCEELADNIINQFKNAELNGDTEIDLIVPKFDTENNWPYGIYQAEHFTKVMYRHKITHTKIYVRKMVPSKEMTQKYITS